MMSRLYADRQSQLDRAGIWISQGVWSQVEREWAQRAEIERWKIFGRQSFPHEEDDQRWRQNDKFLPE